MPPRGRGGGGGRSGGRSGRGGARKSSGGRGSSRSGGARGKGKGGGGKGQKSSKSKSGGKKGGASKPKKKSRGGGGGKKKGPSALRKLLSRYIPCLEIKKEVSLEGMAQNAVKLLGFSEKDCSRIKTRFDDIDIDGTGEIDYQEFLEDVGEPRSPFVDAVFSLVDVNGNGNLDFGEYIQIFCVYCTYNRDEILTFVYECFDADGSGTIDEEEFMLLAKTVAAAAPMFPGNFGRALEEFDVNGDGLIDMDEFRELNRRYPLVLFPAFRLQDNLQRGSLGLKRWNQILSLRQKTKVLREYRKTHNGQLPPIPLSTRLGMKFCCCCVKGPYSDVVLDFDDDIGSGTPNSSPTPKKEEKKKKKKKKKK